MKTKVNIIILLLLLFIPTSMTYAEETKGFIDIKSSDWYQQNISKLTAMGGISGYPDGTFRPNKEITKAEFIKVLISSLGFNDLDKTNDHWASGYINQGEKLNIIEKNKLIDIDKPITRYEMTKIISNTLSYKNEPIPTNLYDYQPLIKDFNKIPNTKLSECVLESFVKGIVSGYPDGNFLGDRSLTRAEATTVIIRILDEDSRKIPQLPLNVSFEKEVLRLVNMERQKVGLSALVNSKELDYIAKLKSEDMALFDYFSHISPNYGSPFDMIQKNGITYKIAAENIAKGYKTPEDVVKAWMESPGHKANILNQNFDRLGIGVYFGQSTYWTQIFTN